MAQQPFKAPLRVPKDADSPPVRLEGPGKTGKPSPNPTPPKTGGR